jgi:hypothetical protein
VAVNVPPILARGPVEFLCGAQQSSDLRCGLKISARGWALANLAAPSARRVATDQVTICGRFEDLREQCDRRVDRTW